MAASKESMHELHDLVCRELTRTLRDGIPVYHKETGEEVGREPASAAYVAAAIKFLKDNNIEALLTPNSPLHGIIQNLPVFNDDEEPVERPN